MISRRMVACTIRHIKPLGLSLGHLKGSRNIAHYQSNFLCTLSLGLDDSAYFVFNSPHAPRADGVCILFFPS